jgi:hypothetical protein
MLGTDSTVPSIEAAELGVASIRRIAPTVADPLDVGAARLYARRLMRGELVHTRVVGGGTAVKTITAHRVAATSSIVGTWFTLVAFNTAPRACVIVRVLIDCVTVTTIPLASLRVAVDVTHAVTQPRQPRTSRSQARSHLPIGTTAIVGVLSTAALVAAPN